MIEDDRSTAERVRSALDEIRPALRADGGDIELVEIVEAEGVVRVRLLGACHGCPMARSTLTDFVSDRIRLHAPEIERVESV